MLADVSEGGIGSGVGGCRLVGNGFTELAGEVRGCQDAAGVGGGEDVVVDVGQAVGALRRT